jgi:hypothetical protein
VEGACGGQSRWWRWPVVAGADGGGGIHACGHGAHPCHFQVTSGNRVHLSVIIYSSVDRAPTNI